MLILHEKIELLMAKENFPLKKGNFEPIGQKDGNGNIFRVKKSHILRCAFLTHSVELKDASNNFSLLYIIPKVSKNFA